MGEETYTVKCLCGNCGNEIDSISIPKGRSVKKSICPVCGCIGYLEVDVDDNPWK